MPPNVEFLDRAIEAHVQWRMRLSAAITNKETAALDRATVCSDHKCELGKWILADSASYVGNADFEGLRLAHKRFHESIGKVIDLAGANKVEEAKAEMRSGDFKKYSTEVVLCISKIKSFVHQST